jgi:hypothetical protein
LISVLASFHHAQSHRGAPLDAERQFAGEAFERSVSIADRGRGRRRSRPVNTFSVATTMSCCASCTLASDVDRPKIASISDWL